VCIFGNPAREDLKHANVIVRKMKIPVAKRCTAINAGNVLKPMTVSAAPAARVCGKKHNP
jgi:hypothetical protein